MFPEEDRSIIAKFQDSAVVYDFTFDMTEIDNLDATLDFLGVFRHTSFTSGLSGGLDRTREGISTFTIADTFSELLKMEHPGEEYDLDENGQFQFDDKGNKKTKLGYCSKYVKVSNFLYPVTGTIGIDKIVNNFVNLSLFSNLYGVADAQGRVADKDKTTPATGDTVIFTTKLSGALTPKFTFGPAFRGGQIADASLNASTSRMDVHKLIIALALPPKDTPVVKSATADKNTVSSGSFITVNTTTPAEVVAAKKIDQIIFRFELGRAGAVTVVTQ